MNVSFFVVGFNLYHSVLAAEHDGYGKLKWLDIKSLCFSCKQIFAGEAILHQIHYFSAYAYHREPKKPGTVKRHQDWIKCLKDTGVIDHIGQFFEKQITAGCTDCYVRIKTHEEKETDVSIAVSVLESLATDTDIAVIVSGDTDLLPSVHVAKRLFPAKQILFAFPYKRKNDQIQKTCPGSFRITPKRYATHQFPNPFTLKDGTEISKPLSW